MKPYYVFALGVASVIIWYLKQRIKFLKKTKKDFVIDKQNSLKIDMKRLRAIQAKLKRDEAIKKNNTLDLNDPWSGLRGNEKKD